LRLIFKFEEGNWIWKKGDTPSFVFLILKGSIEVTYDSADYGEDEDNTDEFTSGVFVGETSAILSSGKSKLSVQAMSKLQLLTIDTDKYLHFLETNPKLLVNLASKEVIE
jgi:CRP-like cAMP-binding protein